MQLYQPYSLCNKKKIFFQRKPTWLSACFIIYVLKNAVSALLCLKICLSKNKDDIVSLTFKDVQVHKKTDIVQINISKYFIARLQYFFYFFFQKPSKCQYQTSVLKTHLLVLHSDVNHRTTMDFFFITSLIYTSG